MGLDSGVTSEKVSGALAVTPSYPEHYPMNFEGLNYRRGPSKTWSGSVWSNGSHQRPEGAGCRLGPGEARVGCRKSLNSLRVSLGESSPCCSHLRWMQRCPPMPGPTGSSIICGCLSQPQALTWSKSHSLLHTAIVQPASAPRSANSGTEPYSQCLHKWQHILPCLNESMTFGVILICPIYFSHK